MGVRVRVRVGVSTEGERRGVREGEGEGEKEGEGEGDGGRSKEWLGEAWVRTTEEGEGGRERGEVEGEGTLFRMRESDEWAEKVLIISGEGWGEDGMGELLGVITAGFGCNEIDLCDLLLRAISWSSCSCCICAVVCVWVKGFFGGTVRIICEFVDAVDTIAEIWGDVFSGTALTGGLEDTTLKPEGPRFDGPLLGPIDDDVVVLGSMILGAPDGAIDWAKLSGDISVGFLRDPIFVDTKLDEVSWGVVVGVIDLIWGVVLDTEGDTVVVSAPLRGIIGDMRLGSEMVGGVCNVCGDDISWGVVLAKETDEGRDFNGGVVKETVEDDVMLVGASWDPIGGALKVDMGGVATGAEVGGGMSVSELCSWIFDDVGAIIGDTIWGVVIVLTFCDWMVGVVAGGEGFKGIVLDCKKGLDERNCPVFGAVFDDSRVVGLLDSEGVNSTNPGNEGSGCFWVFGSSKSSFEREEVFGEEEGMEDETALKENLGRSEERIWATSNPRGSSREETTEGGVRLGARIGVNDMGSLFSVFRAAGWVIERGLCIIGREVRDGCREVILRG